MNKNIAAILAVLMLSVIAIFVVKSLVDEPSSIIVSTSVVNTSTFSSVPETAILISSTTSNKTGSIPEIITSMPMSPSTSYATSSSITPPASSAVITTPYSKNEPIPLEEQVSEKNDVPEEHVVVSSAQKTSTAVSPSSSVEIESDDYLYTFPTFDLDFEEEDIPVIDIDPSLLLN